MNEAIKRAQEGGYKVNEKYAEMVEAQSHILLDPEFWKCLGKHEGWIEICSNPDHGFIEAFGNAGSGDIGRLGCPLCGHNEDHVIESTRFRWRKEWHRFIDSLIEGQTPDEFFNTLLK